MKISIPIEIDEVISHLPMKEKIRLVRRLERETRGRQLDELVARIRARPSIRQLSVREIDHIVEDTRRTRYARSSRRS